jgi:hypothetical protein
VFGNRMLRRIFGPIKNRKNKGQGIINNELYNM